MESKTKRPYSRMPNSNPRLLLGGMPFLGDLFELQTLHLKLDKAAAALEAAQPQRFPAGTGKARHTLLVFLRLEFDTGITFDTAIKWLAAQKWSVF